VGHLLRRMETPTWEMWGGCRGAWETTWGMGEWRGVKALCLSLRASCWQTQTQALDFLSQSYRTRACWSRPHPPSLPSCHQTLPGSRTWMQTRAFELLLLPFKGHKNTWNNFFGSVLLMHSNMWYLVPVQWCDYSSDRNQLLWCDISSFKLLILLYSLPAFLCVVGCWLMILLQRYFLLKEYLLLKHKNHIFPLVKIYNESYILIQKLCKHWKSDHNI